ncbi:MAG: bifunctional glutamate N-acetyltransferase/amino-acid acetyltransferase ArgJ [Nitrospirae bacterium]|nr:bifunctional glutamate N-acetyltransferase/amino-acid acetyltransferase ArgJ [Nitrospirota bacterium]
MTRVPGFRTAGIAAGIKKAARRDLALLVSDAPAHAAGVFTTNRVKAAPVLLDMERIRSGRGQAVVVNSGCANAYTGAQGLRDARAMAAEAARVLGVSEELVYVCSTGVIGMLLPMDRVLPGIGKAAGELAEEGWTQAAEAIMTTDTVPKIAGMAGEIQGRPVHLMGIAKGAGMIHPHMATMLAFLATDAALEAGALSVALKGAVDRSFNCISVDGDMSTNDTVLCFANGLAGNPPLAPGRPGWDAFQTLLDAVCRDLAWKIVRDGEGATKFVEIAVLGAVTPEEAKTVAHAVARSSLVKTALFGEDPNWGRVVAAAGSCQGVSLDPDQIDLLFGTVPVVVGGQGTGKEAEAAAAQVLKQREIRIVLDLHLGSSSATVWTCDLSEEYVRINAAYRT